MFKKQRDMKEFVCQATDFIVIIREIMNPVAFVVKIAIIEDRIKIGSNVV